MHFWKYVKNIFSEGKDNSSNDDFQDDEEKQNDESSQQKESAKEEQQDRDSQDESDRPEEKLQNREQQEQESEPKDESSKLSEESKKGEQQDLDSKDEDIKSRDENQSEEQQDGSKPEEIQNGEQQEQESESKDESSKLSEESKKGEQQDLDSKDEDIQSRNESQSEEQQDKDSKDEDIKSKDDSQSEEQQEKESQDGSSRSEELQNGKQQGQETESKDDSQSEEQQDKELQDGSSKLEEETQNGEQQQQESEAKDESDKSSEESKKEEQQDKESQDGSSKLDTKSHSVEQKEKKSEKENSQLSDEPLNVNMQGSQLEFSDSQTGVDSQISDEEQSKKHSDDSLDDNMQQDKDSDSDEVSDEQLNSDTSDSENERNKKLKELRDKLLQYALKKQEEEAKRKNLERSHLQSSGDEPIESEEEKYELSDHANKFLDSLKELPSFKDRDRGPGYGINTNGYTDVSDSVIRTLISKFLNRRFCRKNTDLNVRSNSLKKTKGFYKWEVKDVITHLETEQVTKVLSDKYGYEYENGKNESVPLSFYFDMSCSMSKYTNLLAVIAIELLKKGVKVLIGFNERVNVQIDSIKGNVDVQELANLLQVAGYSTYDSSTSKARLSSNGLFKFKFINENLDNYLIHKKAEKCVVFADFDPISEVCNLSSASEVYWFCFEEDFSEVDLDSFHGFIYKVQNEDDIARGLIKVNENKFEALCFTENPKELIKKKE